MIPVRRSFVRGHDSGTRIDDRLRRFMAGSAEPAAEVTRRVGALAEDLYLSRPSYQQVRVLLIAARPSNRGVRRDVRLVELLDRLYDYPGPGLADVYRRYQSGGL